MKSFKSVKAKFDEIMRKQIKIWPRPGGAGGHGVVTRAIINHSPDPDETVNDIEEFELLHPDVIVVIRENLEEFKNGRNPVLF